MSGSAAASWQGRAEDAASSRRQWKDVLQTIVDIYRACKAEPLLLQIAPSSWMGAQFEADAAHKRLQHHGG